jgi:hypothetical protein
MNKHTPGPWKILPLEESKYYSTAISVGDGRVQLCGTEPPGAPWEPSSREIANGWNMEDCGTDHVEGAYDYANACLIAAAPELYDALHELLRCFGALVPWIEEKAAIENAYRVLAMAKGEYDD